MHARIIDGQEEEQEGQEELADSKISMAYNFSRRGEIVRDNRYV